MYYDLTRGKISRSLILFALPMIAGNLLQQFYNIADTLIVGRVLGSNALAAVGSSYTLILVDGRKQNTSGSMIENGFDPGASLCRPWAPLNASK